MYTNGEFCYLEDKEFMELCNKVIGQTPLLWSSRFILRLLDNFAEYLFAGKSTKNPYFPFNVLIQSALEAESPETYIKAQGQQKLVRGHSPIQEKEKAFKKHLLSF